MNTRAPFPPRFPETPYNPRLRHYCPFGGPDYLMEPWSNPESGVENMGDCIALEYDDAYGQVNFLVYYPSRHD